MNTHEVTLDVSKEPANVPALYLGQGDANGTTLVVNLFDNGQYLDLAGKGVQFCMRSPRGNDYYEVPGTVEGNVATFEIDETYAAGYPGATDIAYVRVTNGETEATSTARMRVVVLPSAKEGVDPAPAYKELIDEFIEENQEAVDEIIEAAQEVLDDGIPLMTSTRRGGAKLGQGLKVDSDTLSLGNLVESGTGAEVVTDGCAIYSVDGEGWATQDGTPTPDNPVEIEVARGRNLLDESAMTDGYYINDSGVITSATGNRYSGKIPVSVGETYSFSVITNDSSYKRVVAYNSSDGFVSLLCKLPQGTAGGLKTETFTIPANTSYVRVSCNTADSNVQLELGSTPTPYVPYGHVGLEVRENGTLVSCTPIPLPSKGFAASLPDGTADALTVDSAGRWEWVNGANSVIVDNTLIHYTYQDSGVYTKENTLDGVMNNAVGYCSHFIVGSNTNNMICKIGAGNTRIYFTKFWSVIGATTLDEVKAWFAANPVTVLYPLATPTTEHGYISDWPSEIPEGAVISCPELQSIGVAWFVPGAREIAQHVYNVYKRIEAAIAEVATS